MFLFSSCNLQNPKTEVRNNDIEYIMRFDISNHIEHYVFYLIQDNKIIAYYEDANSNYEELYVELSDYNISLMDSRIEEVLTLDEDDVEGYECITDFWLVTLDYNNKKAVFDYGASKSTNVNILLEQIIGCCNFKKAKKDLLLPVGSYFRYSFEEIAK